MERLIGLSLAMLDGSDLQETADRFWTLQERFPLAACEIHGETALFPAALPSGDRRFLGVCRNLRDSVGVLGFHLPFIDLNPVSASPGAARMSLDILLQALDTAAEISADYVVFHARGRRHPETRRRDISAWKDVLHVLGRHAEAGNLRFWLENADDLRCLAEVGGLAEATGIDICLDVGHLYERYYDDPAWTVVHRAAARIQDVFSPCPFLLNANLPVAEAGGIDGLIRSLGRRIAGIHLHNHDGRRAHRTLARGSIPWRRLIGHAGLPPSAPLILEADYRSGDQGAVEADLDLLVRQLEKTKTK